MKSLSRIIHLLSYICYGCAFVSPSIRSFFDVRLPKAPFSLFDRTSARVDAIANGKVAHIASSFKKNEALASSEDGSPVEVPGDHEATAASDDSIEPSPLQSIRFRNASRHLLQAGLVGAITGIYVAAFKLSINLVKDVCYRQAWLSWHESLQALVPAIGGLGVGLLLLMGEFSPGIADTIKQVDNYGVQRPNLRDRLSTQLAFLRKSAAAVFTLGTGCSLGPEGPCVEIGMNAAKVIAGPQRWTMYSEAAWNRILLSCGAAAGVSAGFNAPIAGVFFALEIIHNTFSKIDEDLPDKEVLAEATSDVVPILLACVTSALVGKAILGDHLVLHVKDYMLRTPLLELPAYAILGAASGFVSFKFSQVAMWSRSFFDGSFGPSSLRKTMSNLPPHSKPVIGGLLCGLVALQFPQILFFGYSVLDPLLANTKVPSAQLLSLIFVKTLITGASAGSGLVGGVFAPSLFLGVLTGGLFHNVLTTLNIGMFALADVPAYAMVGAASVLASLFRAPLTATLLLFEVTRDYGVILPIMASSGIANVVGSILDVKLERAKSRFQLRRQSEQSNHASAA